MGIRENKKNASRDARGILTTARARSGDEPRPKMEWIQGNLRS